jgi:hypothetical protein
MQLTARGSRRRWLQIGFELFTKRSTITIRLRRAHWPPSHLLP